ncbi:MAG: J domain-containing protein [Eggerthellaceae bacterium]|jgi:hypothetical protein|nr:J domain-containing protein [Eggerthellaceae bacterium]MDR2721537.1 J domain-containing protein [Coriobacteriaceae bacterium]
MNRIEALRILGLDGDASNEDIKTAYKEMAQILHPDRFASSRKLQDKATEQFKNLQEAYDLLTSGKLGKASSSKGSSTRAAYGQNYSTARELEARLAGIAAAKTQLVAQKDTMLDERRNGLIMIVLGVALCLVFRRMPLTLALGSTGAVWGIVKTIATLSTLKNLDEHIGKLSKEQKQLARELEDLEQ